MSHLDQALSWPCQGLQQIGILSRPAQTQPSCAVLLIVGGPQVRVGSHRQFVELARGLAAAGFAVLRFDARGMGDSEGQPAGFEVLDDDIAAALDALHAAVPGLQQTVLWGLCDAASAALLYLDARPDPRVSGLILLNPWVRSAQSEAQARVKHYYRERLLQPAFWRKLLAGGVGLGALRGWWQLRRQAGSAAAPRLHFAQRMARAWASFGGPILLILSEKDMTAQEFQLVRSRWPAPQARLAEHEIAGASHTFSEPGMKAQVQALCCDWLRP
jgi:uncharacterized protein